MTTSRIRNIDDGVKMRLRIRAARNGRSMEAELRDVLNRTLHTDASREPDLPESIRRRFSSFDGVEIEPHPSVPVREPPSSG